MKHRQHFLFVLLIVFTSNTGYCLDTQLKTVDVTVLIHGDGKADVQYVLDWSVSSGTLHGFYFEGMAVEPIFVRDHCYALLSDGNIVSLEIKKLAEKYYDIVLAGGRGFSGNGRFYLHYKGDMAESGSVGRRKDASDGDSFFVDWSPVQWATSITRRTVRIVLPIQVPGERVKDNFLEQLNLTIEPHLRKENTIDYVGTKGEDGSYYVTVQFHQKNIPPYQVQQIQLSIDADKLSHTGFLKEQSKGAVSHALSKDSVTQSNALEAHRSPVLFFILAAAAGISLYLGIKKQHLFAETMFRFKTAIRGTEERNRQGKREPYRFAYCLPFIPFPIRLFLFLLFAVGGLFLQLLLLFPGNLLLGFALVFLAGIVMTAGSNMRIKTESREEWKAIKMKEFSEMRKNLEIVEIMRQPLLVKKTESRLLFLCLFGFLLFFGAVSSGVTGIIMPLVAAVDAALLFSPVFLSGFVDVRGPRNLKLKMDHFASLIRYTEEQTHPLPLKPYGMIETGPQELLIPEDMRLDVESRNTPQGVLSVQFKTDIRRDFRGFFPSTYAVCYVKDHEVRKALEAAEWNYVKDCKLVLDRGEDKDGLSVEIRVPFQKEEQFNSEQNAVFLYTAVEKNLSSLGFA